LVPAIACTVNGPDDPDTFNPITPIGQRHDLDSG
jgi:hypothetical protein